ncbi:MAG: ABC transporter permease [Candidatus Theseobacter exili]|nr:ABC transporter permease [Candidatus Theseobacter exili]
MKKHSKMDKRIVWGILLLGVLIIGAIGAPIFAKQPPLEIKLVECPQSPSLSHPMGTDNLGRDIWSRVLYGGRTTLAIGFTAATVTVLLGIFIGMLCGYFGGKTDMILNSLIDVMLAFPYLLLAIGIAAAIGPGIRSILIALVAAGWASTARLVRGIVFKARTADYITASRSLGASHVRIIAKHILPAIMPNILIIFALSAASSILAESSLSFLGLGVQPPDPSWGQMVRQGAVYLRIAPWWSLFPGLAIATAVFGSNLLGDCFRDLIEKGKET